MKYFQDNLEIDWWAAVGHNINIFEPGTKLKVNFFLVFFQEKFCNSLKIKKFSKKIPKYFSLANWENSFRFRNMETI